MLRFVAQLFVVSQFVVIEPPLEEKEILRLIICVFVVLQNLVRRFTVPKKFANKNMTIVCW